jgi:hypothetical protein
MSQQNIQLAIGNCMSSTNQVKSLEWYIQGHTFTKDMIVLDQLPYDAILVIGFSSSALCSVTG